MFFEDENIIEDFWPSISDLMSGLMIIFLFISISFMIEITNKNKIIEINKILSEKEALEKVITKYKTGKVELYNELYKEFSSDLLTWDATLDKESLSITFNEPEIFFKRGERDISNAFKIVLNDFFPRYIKILSSNKYINEIEEIRIEGHTSSEWATWSSSQESYFKNMELSQARTVETLKYVMMLESLKEKEKFLIDKLTANGLSYSKRVIDINGRENHSKSRRVEFKIRTKAEKYLDEMFRKIEDK